MTELPDTPLLQASFLLAKAFGWTPSQVLDLTMAQVSTYLDLLALEKQAK